LLRRTPADCLTAGGNAGCAAWPEGAERERSMSERTVRESDSDVLCENIASSDGTPENAEHSETLPGSGERSDTPENAEHNETPPGSGERSDDTPEGGRPRPRRRWYPRIMGGVGVILLLGIVLAYVPGVGNWYAEKIYPRIHAVGARMTGALPFCLGEVLMFAAAICVVVTLGIGLTLLVRAAILRATGRGERRYVPGWVRVYGRVFAALVAAGLWLYVFQWWLPYHDEVLGTKEHRREFTLEEVRVARNAVAEILLEAMPKLPRDADGRLIYPDAETVYRLVGESANGLADRYPRLAGYCPSPKVSSFSDVLDWMGIGGYTYPYTMEITYNRYVSNLYRYELLAHETSHNKGYFKENEAEFLGFLICCCSDDPLMRYCGSIYTFWDLDDMYCDLLLQAYDPNTAGQIYRQQPQVDTDTLSRDIVNSAQEAQEEYAADDHPLEQYQETATEIAEQGWETQAALIEEVSYRDYIYLALEYFAQESAER